jgi:hypothetical protein
MARKKQPPGHFERGYNQLGWVYIARNDIHKEDIYKVGYTEKTPEERVNSLNTAQKRHTGQIGFFQLIYAVAVLDSQGCEQALFKRVEKLKESPKKEFVNAPLELLIGELLNIQKKDHALVSAKCVCSSCGQVVSFCPLPHAKLTCSFCEAEFQVSPDGSTSQRVSKDARPISYFAPGLNLEMRRHSPIAKAFLEFRIAFSNYFNGISSDDEFFTEAERLLEIDVAFDRVQHAHKPIKPERQHTTRPPRSRKGWMDCPQCLSSIPIDPTGEIIWSCHECGWHTEE